MTTSPVPRGIMSPNPRAALIARAGEYKRAADKLAYEKVALRYAVIDAVADGMSEVEAARLAGVSRMTVRAWLGKGK